MINNDNENSTNTVMNKQSKSLTSDQNNGIMSSTSNLNNTNNDEQPVQPKNNDLNQNESQDQQSIDLPQEQQQQDEEEQNDDEFIRITAAHQVLTEAQAYDEQRNFPAALHLYRICVDLLLEELMFTDGTEQSRVYLREKCTAIMDRIDVLKTMLEPIPPQAQAQTQALPPPPTTTTTNNEQTTNAPTEELNSLHLS